MRCFISINLPEQVRKTAGEFISTLKKTGADARWSTPDSLHLTLKFLGETDEKIIPVLIEELRKKISPLRPVYIKITGAGSFPSARRPRVVWLGVEASEGLAEIRERVEKVCMEFGFESEDRPFSPHLTIGRVKSERKSSELMKALNVSEKLFFGEVLVESIHLMKSELKPGGAVHTVVREISMQGRDNEHKGNQ